MNSPENITAIKAEQLRQMFSVSSLTLVSSVVLAAILVYLQREVIAFSIIVSWFSLVVLVALGRGLLSMAYQRAYPLNPEVLGFWVGSFRLGVLISGLVWGAAGFLLFPVEYPAYQMFLVFMLAGLTAGSLVSYSVDAISAIAYIISALVPIAVRLLLMGDHLFTAMAGAVILYMGFMIMSLRHINRNSLENIALRLDAIEREKNLRASEERYRLLLNYSPVGIFHYDADLVITYSNKHFAEILQSSVENLLGLDMKCLHDAVILPSLRRALVGEIGEYEGRYQATHSNAEIWAYMICAPFCDNNDAIIGGIGIVQDISLRKAADEQIKSLAFFDPLTNLPNRRLLQDRIQHALLSSFRSGRKGALLLIDLDNFKALNDTQGHDIGDQLLQQVAYRILSCMKEGDTVGRFGGDEFVVLLEDLGADFLEAAEHAEVFGEIILDRLNQVYQLKGHEYHSTPSIGIALFNDSHETMDELFKQADIAMYQAKKSGRNKLFFFDQDMQANINARALMEAELRKAIEKQQLQLFYQPQVNENGKLLGAEALTRWQHPQKGEIAPTVFIPLAEETGLILSIGQWVLEAACAQLKEWQNNADACGLVLSINISSLQFQQPNFVSMVKAAVENYAITPAFLKFELTESLLLNDVDSIITTMNALKDIGIQFSLDDFGTGYSSLQYVKKLPLQQLKIDQSFVQDVATDRGDQAIVKAIIVMAKSLALEVVAEGVDTEQQRQFLYENGCRNYQGFLFGKPLSAEDFCHKFCDKS
jgi:diguanylate cyclase (GGDEF)-like protein/PAS domain S-box-containing protein